MQQPAFFKLNWLKEVREKSRECHNHKPQPFPDPMRKRKPTNLNKHKPNKRTKSTKISSLFPKRGNRNTKRTEKHKNKMTHGKTYNKSPRRINHKATKSKTNTGTKAVLPKSDWLYFPVWRVCRQKVHQQLSLVKFWWITGWSAVTLVIVWYPRQTAWFCVFYSTKNWMCPYKLDRCSVQK